jgi:hypothetical protein
MLASGSDQRRSAKAPSWGSSWKRLMSLMWSRERTEGERPPWTQKMESEMTAEIDM